MCVKHTKHFLLTFVPVFIVLNSECGCKPVAFCPKEIYKLLPMIVAHNLLSNKLKMKNNVDFGAASSYFSKSFGVTFDPAEAVAVLNDGILLSLTIFLP